MESLDSGLNVRKTFLVFAVSVVMAVNAVTIASAQGTRPSQPTPTQPGRSVLQPTPVLPAKPGGAPGSAVQSNEPILPKPDYAIVVASQQEFENGAMAWRFRVENKGGAAGRRASVVLSIGIPCPGGENWQTLISFPVPALPHETGLDPGKTSVTPAMPYRLPANYVGKGCQLKAVLQPHFADGDASNNTVHLFTKKLMLPDLIVDYSAANGFYVKNIGDAVAGPSLFHYYCQTLDPDKSCGPLTQKRKEQATVEKPVPALNPGESYKVEVFPRDGVFWSAQADKKQQVFERNEGNNALTSGDLK